MSTRTKALQKPKFPSALEIHTSVVRAFLVNHCSDFEWFREAMGALRARHFKKLLDLAETVSTSLLHWHVGGEERPTKYDAAAFKAASQFVALVGKYQFDPSEIPGLDPVKAALSNFLSAERRNRRLNIVFASHLERGTDRHWCVPLVRQVVHDVLGQTPHYGEILRKCDFSGGASVLHHGDDTHLATKLLGGCFSGPESAFDYFVEGMWKNEHYRRHFLVSRGPYVCYDFEVFRSELRARYKVVDHNQITVVPKKATSGRTIAMESEVCNFLQKGIDLEMREKLKRILGIDLSKQGPNQIMSLHGSFGHAECNPYVTLDVRDASNGVLRESVRAVVPPRWFKLLDQTRSSCYMLPGESSSTPYNMFCSMGNGFCFPLETLLFSAIVIAAHRHCGAPLAFRTYGDDIICRRSVALVVIECLSVFGFRTNVSKTFLFSPFRESCGANWYGGRDVTPGYFKERVSSQNALHAIHNTLRSWPDVQAEVRKLSPVGLRFCVSERDAVDRFTDQAFVVSHDLAMTAPNTKWDKATQTWSYAILTGIPVPDPAWTEDGRVTTNCHLDWIVHTAVLRGAATSKAPFHFRRASKRLMVDLMQAGRNASIRSVKAITP